MTSQRLVFLALIGVCAQAQAQFSGVAEFGSAFTYQADQTVILSNYYPGGGAFSANDPLTTNIFGGDSMTTRLNFVATHVISSNYLELDGSFSGLAITHFGNPSGTLVATSQAYSEVFFTSAGLTSVTMTAFNASSSGGGSDSSFSEMNFDGIFYQFTPGNTSASFTVGAGPHFMWYDVSCNVYSGEYSGTDSYSQISSDFKLTATTVPEPASMAALGLGAIGLIKRRRR